MISYDLFLVRQSCFIQLDEQILRPFVVVRKTGGHFLLDRATVIIYNLANQTSPSLPTHPVPVEAESQAVQLLPHGLDIAEVTQGGNVGTKMAQAGHWQDGTGAYTYFLVHSSGSRPLSMAAFSAGSPKASHPIGFITCISEKVCVIHSWEIHIWIFYIK